MEQVSHLPKVPSDLKQKCTQFLTPFLGTVFNALSLGVIHFVRSVSLRNRFLFGWNSSTANQKTSISRFVKLTLRTKRIAPCERASKSVPVNGVRNCVHFCLLPLEPLERCDFAKECYKHCRFTPFTFMRKSRSKIGRSVEILRLIWHMIPGRRQTKKKTHLCFFCN